MDTTATTSAVHQRQRARFEAVRAQMFQEASLAAARWRLIWIVPFNLFVLALLVVQGQPPGRALVQLAAVLLSVGLLAQNVRHPVTSCGKPVGMYLATIPLFVCILNTGGLASPLLVMAVPLLVGATFSPISARARAGVLALLFGGVVFMALASRTSLGQLA